jgi:hypothetical protein
VNIIIVTGDKDFSHLIALVKQKCFDIVAVLTEQGMGHNQLMLDADVIWKFRILWMVYFLYLKKQTSHERQEGRPLVGCETKLMGIVEFLQQERIHSSMDNMRLLFEENLILIEEKPILIEENPIVKSKKKKEETPEAPFRKTLVMAVLMSKIVEEMNTYVKNQLAKRHVSLVYSMEPPHTATHRKVFYCLVGTHSSQVSISSPTPCAEVFPLEVWKNIGKAIKKNQTLQNELAESTNIFVDACALRKHCKFIKQFYLDIIISFF